MRIGPLGIWELLIILVVVLLIFGPRRLPEMAKGLGQSVREFRKGIRDIRNDFEEGETSDAAPPSQASAAAAPAAPAPAQAAPPPAAETAATSDDATSDQASSDEARSDDASDDARTKAASDA